MRLLMPKIGTKVPVFFAIGCYKTVMKFGLGNPLI